MCIKDGFMINENQLIKWNICYDELIAICEKGNIKCQCEKTNTFMKISLPIEFAPLGVVQATFYFFEDLIRIVYITKTNEKVFEIDRYLLVNEKLINYFGKPILHKKDKTIWRFGKIEMKHYYTFRDDILMDYLVLENGSK